MTHRIVHGLRTARRLSASEERVLPKPQSVAQQQGLRYERKVRDELKRLINLHGGFLEYNPWFTFEDHFGAGDCVPDILLHHKEGCITVIEVKLTYVVEAISKLELLYCPVVQHVTDACVHALVIARNLTPNSPRPRPAIITTDHQSPVLQWLGHGHITW